MHRRLTRRLAAAAGAVLVLSMMPHVSAASATLVVDGDGAADPGNCAGGGSAYQTIQAAVDAAVSDDMIQVCPGTYAESVVVPETTARLRILGPQAGVDARHRDVGVDNEAIVDPPAEGSAFSLLASNTVLDGFTLEGADGNAAIVTSPMQTRYKIDDNIVDGNMLGVDLSSSGVDNTLIRYNRFSDNSLPGTNSGYAIYSSQGASNVIIRANSFDGHTSAAIALPYVAEANDSISVENNRSVDDATFLNVQDAADMRVLRNRTADTDPADDAQQGPGIRVGGQSTNVLLKLNRLQNPASSGIVIRDDGLGTGVAGIQILENTVSAAGESGLDVDSHVAGVVQALDNTFANNAVDGISMSAATRANLLRRNDATGNSGFDCHDESVGGRTAGTANRWRADHGDTDQPDGICSPI